jgi:hypothetical protein
MLCLIVIYVIIFVQCIAVRCVSPAVISLRARPVGLGLRNRIVIVVRKCPLFPRFHIVGYVFVKVKVMFSVPKFRKFSCIFGLVWWH